MGEDALIGTSKIYSQLKYISKNNERFCWCPITTWSYFHRSL